MCEKNFKGTSIFTSSPLFLYGQTVDDLIYYSKQNHHPPITECLSGGIFDSMSDDEYEVDNHNDNDNDNNRNFSWKNNGDNHLSFEDYQVECEVECKECSKYENIYYESTDKINKCNHKINSLCGKENSIVNLISRTNQQNSTFALNFCSKTDLNKYLNYIKPLNELVMEYTARLSYVIRCKKCLSLICKKSAIDHKKHYCRKYLCITHSVLRDNIESKCGFCFKEYFVTYNKPEKISIPSEFNQQNNQSTFQFIEMPICQNCIDFFFKHFNNHLSIIFFRHK